MPLTPKPKPAKPPVFTVLCEGYTRVVKHGRAVVTTHLPDLKFKICRVCKHWERSGARTFCPCNCHQHAPEIL